MKHKISFASCCLTNENYLNRNPFTRNSFVKPKSSRIKTNLGNWITNFYTPKKCLQTLNNRMLPCKRICLFYTQYWWTGETERFLLWPTLRVSTMWQDVWKLEHETLFVSGKHIMAFIPVDREVKALQQFCCS